MRVYYFTSAKWALDNIRNQRIKVARIKNLNDPFDFFVNAYIPCYVPMDGDELKDRYHKVYGLLCFSENYSDPVHWAHYGERQSGVALGFDVNDDLLNKVTYSDEPFTVYFSDSEGTDEEWGQVYTALTYKYKHWQYEAEHRMILELSEAVQRFLPGGDEVYYKYFDDDLILREVILGMKCSISSDLFIDAIKNQDNILLLMADVSPDEYKVKKPIFIAKTDNGTIKVGRFGRDFR